MFVTLPAVLPPVTAVALLAMAAPSAVPNLVGVPRYIIDLDLPPEQRWNQVIDDYKGTSTAFVYTSFPAHTLTPLSVDMLRSNQGHR